MMYRRVTIKGCIVALPPIILVASLLAACGRSEMKGEMPEDEYFRTAKTRYIVSGQKYDVPMGYQWWVHIKYRKWPQPKKEYTETSAFEVFALLPDFLPYSRATAERFDAKRGFGEVVNIQVKSGNFRSFEELVEIWREGGKFTQVDPDANEFGLLHFVHQRGKKSPERSWQDVYVPAVPAPVPFWIRCARGVPFPACYLHDPAALEQPRKEIVFSRDYLPAWRDIRERAAALVRSLQSHDQP